MPQGNTLDKPNLDELYRDVILDHYRKVGKLSSTKGGTNPFYTLIVS